MTEPLSTALAGLAWIALLCLGTWVASLLRHDASLIDRVWGSDYVGDTKTLDVHVKRLRSKIEPDPSVPRYLVTVRGLGYKFEP